MAPDVKLEVLDWGGVGPSILFLAGAGNTAHVFDEFAPALADQFHAYGTTRRGFGASSIPATGYDLATLCADLRQVLDALHLDRVTLIGSSSAGEELTWFAGTHPDRVDRLVYLDAAYDRTESQPEALGGCVNVEPPTKADLTSAASFGAWFARSRGVALPESEIHAMFDADGPPESSQKEFLQSVVHPNYTRMAAPALAIYAVPGSAADFYPGWAAMDSAARAKAQACFDHGKEQEAARTSRADFRAHAVRGRVVELIHAKHYLFISNRDEVLRETRAFLASGQ